MIFTPKIIADRFAEEYPDYAVFIVETKSGNVDWYEGILTIEFLSGLRKTYYSLNRLLEDFPRLVNHE